ncbi:MAG: hypothetical protein UR61_C0043G0004 [candidate division WS6 bacterium GW2011_GWE1_34_7]|uniref:Pyrimidine nucleoside phosphorylase C-terminal domain-containing protein n=1 Tax=candidate division WS6 bacterium GW2011_GWE1_34_7 TaxID=1619093 RepID=A0A0G0BLV0_9BACT|nr:MAG: hypothetical protein UR61_C0043G0004 [candidate division WS6 bacterium GW2011_GWE1_34_7]
MSYYLKSKSLDLGEDNDFNVVLNSEDAQRMGIREGETLMIGFGEVELFADVFETDTLVKEGEIGLYEEIWENYNVEDGSRIFADIPERSKSLEAISNKLLGHSLSKKDLELIMADIGSKKIREVEIAFFVSTFFNPGFNDDEILWMTEGMASSGDVLSFKEFAGKDGLVVDKHSIGGVAGKGITPTLIPILVSGGLLVPNTSTRAITSPAGTSDILEVVMPVKLTKEQIMEVVKKTGGCMFWGGSLSISPADDIIINVERSLRIQEFQKVLVSIVAKKIAMGVNHVLIDLPYGKGSKLESIEETQMLEKEFKKLFFKVGIECETIKRIVRGPDGPAIGPNLEIKECLKVLERAEDRSKALEDVVLNMADKLFESTEKVARGEGKKYAQQLLESGKALDKFWEIAFAQGATKKIKSSEISAGKFEYDVVSQKSGKVDMINNVELVNIARALGNPKIKEAGIYMHKLNGEKVSKGDVLMTIYATSNGRLESGKKAIDINKLFCISC